MNGLCVPGYSRQRVAEKQTKQKYKVKVAYCDVENLDHQNWLLLEGKSYITSISIIKQKLL